MDDQPQSGYTQANTDVKRFPCRQCGAQLSFSPGLQSLKCQYCGFVNPIPQSAEDIEELDFHQYLEIARQESTLDKDQTVKCQACAAEFTVSGRTTADKCPFCGSNSVIAIAAEVRIRPKSLLPFAIEQRQCADLYKRWISTRWFAPNALKDFARAQGGLTGMYIPYWTYDSKTTSYYTGMRGEHYYTTETYEDSEGRTQTREVQHTAWYPASGTVWHDFDDVLAPGSTTLPTNMVTRVDSWDTKSLVPYDDSYLSGFRAERYNVGLEEGFEWAKQVMARAIEQDIRYDIGGDEQQISSVDTQYDALTFKHVLVPIWIGAYKFRDKSYRFLINGRSGQIFGEAPISPWKVALVVLLGLIVIGVIVYFSQRK
jgi:DNA-directed RNA polymerase subunit RPC12/RpoP